MDVQSIKTFIQVANLENFTKAAEEMNYAQSTVTMQIRRLEEELGFPLFERIGRKNYLTVGGQEFLPHATEILHIMQKASTLGQEMREMKGNLRVGALESLVFAGVVPILSDFRSEFPNVDVFLKIGQASELLSLLKQNQLDIIYISNAVNTDVNIHCAYRRKEEIVFVTDPQHPLAQRKDIPLQEVLGYPFIVAEKTGRCYGRLHEIAMEYELPLHHSVLIDNIAAISALLHDGQSITFLPEYSLIPELQRGELVKLHVDFPPQVYYSQLLYHKNKWLAPFMQSFIQYIREYRPEDGT